MQKQIFAHLHAKSVCKCGTAVRLSVCISWNYFFREPALMVYTVLAVYGTKGAWIPRNVNGTTFYYNVLQ